MFVKFALTAAQPLDILAHRFTISFICASVSLAFTKNKPDLKLREIPLLLVLSMFYPVCFFLFQLYGLIFLPASEAGIIQALSPIFTVPIAALILKERTKAGKIFFIVLSVAGAVFISVMNGINSHAYNFWGAALIMGSTMSKAFYQVITKKLVRRHTVISLNFAMTCAGFIIFNATALLSRISSGTVSGYFSAFSSPLFVVSIIFLGAFASFGTNSLISYSLITLPASTIGAFSNLATILTVTSGVLILHETLYWYHAVGAMMIIAGLYGAARKT